MDMNSLSRIRKQSNLTQEKVASILGVSRKSYQYYESGEITPDFYDELIEKLKEFLIIDETHGIQSLKIIKDTVKEVANKYPYIHTVYLYGSYSTNKATPTSDIDLLVVDDPIGFKGAGFYLELKEKLKKNIGITSYRQLGDSEFLKRVLMEAIKIYG